MNYTEKEVKQRADYCLNCKTRPCTNGCPLNNNIPDFIQAVKNEKYKEAYEILSQTTVLSSVCGRICPHMKQCEGTCIRGIKQEPVCIGKLEAYIGDFANENKIQLFGKNVYVFDKNDNMIEVQNILSNTWKKQKKSSSSSKCCRSSMTKSMNSKGKSMSS